MGFFIYPPSSGGGGGGGTSVHNDLTGIQGGSVTQRYHLTLAQHTLTTQYASTTQGGLLSSTDWNIFNDKWDYDEDTIKLVKVNSAGDADTVGGLSILTAVPADAVFTDTTYAASDFDIKDLADSTDLMISWSGKQDLLVSGTTIKTINGESLLGDGDIVISGGEGGGIEEAPQDHGLYARQNATWVSFTIPVNVSELTNDEGYITTYEVTEGDVTQHQSALSLEKSQISDFGTYEEPLTFSTGLTRVLNEVTCDITQYTDEDAIAAIKGDDAWNATEWDAKQDTLVSGTTIKTINGESILGAGDIVISGGGEGGGVGDHNELNNLQGGVENEYFHLTEGEHVEATQYASASQNGLMPKAYAQFIEDISVGGDLKVGDTLSDGFIVIAQVGEEWLCVAPEDKLGDYLAWSTEQVTTGATSETDGYTNTETLVALGEEEYPAAAYCLNVEYDTTDGGTRPYLPSKDEMLLIINSEYIPSSAGLSDTSYMWSSTEYSSDDAYYGTRIEGGGGATNYMKWWQTSIYPVRRVPSGGGGSLELNITQYTDEDAVAAIKADEEYVAKSDVTKTIRHGSDPDVARPEGFGHVMWIGSVEPNNAENDDTWIDTSE